jgi:hypothetical protein
MVYVAPLDHSPTGVVHRIATLDDAIQLFEVRRRSIVGLASPAISAGEAEAWAAKLTLQGMQRKLRDLEIWPNWTAWRPDGGRSAASCSRGCTRRPNMQEGVSVPGYWTGSKG